MNENKLITIYGARVSKSGKHINLTLVEGEGNQRKFYTACVKLDDQAKVHGIVRNTLNKGEEALIVVPILSANQAQDDFDKLDQVDEVPF